VVAGPGLGRRPYLALRLARQIALTDAQRDDPTADWTSGAPGQTLARGRNGFKPLMRNYVTALSTPGWWRRLAYDQFRDEILWCPWDDDSSETEAPTWRRWDNEDVTRARSALERAGFESAGKEMVRDAVWLVAMQAVVDSAQAWLMALPTWDGVERCDASLVQWGGAEDSDYVRAVGAYLWTALAGRVLWPGCKADMVPILYGRGGARKSTFVAALAPAVDFAGTIDLGHRDADLARAMRGKLVLELAELRGLQGRDSESVKAFLSRTDDEWVPKYKELAERRDRRFVWLGTTDKMDVLHDDAGNLRRWLPVILKGTGEAGVLDIDGLVGQREQCWAEARDRFMGRVPGVQSGVAWEAAERLARVELAGGLERFVREDADASALADWLDGPPEDAVPDADGVLHGEGRARGDQGFALRDAILALGIPPSGVRGHEHRIGAMLRAMGYEKTRDRSRAELRDRWVWRKKE
jgi:Virulence-associated protein E